MTAETLLVGVVRPLLGGRFYSDVAPADTELPFGTYQQVGGETLDPLNNNDPHFYNARIQVNVWSKTREEANTLMRSIEAALRVHPINGRPVGALVARLDEFDGTRGAEQDFTVWWL